MSRGKTMTDPHTTVSPQEVEDETRRVSRLAIRSLTPFLETLGMVSETFLAQVLLALWDSGLYEYMRRHAALDVKSAASELSLEESVLQSLVDYLVGQGLLKPGEGGLVLTEKGGNYWNYVTRGVLTCYVGGYNPLLCQLGPLLRKEIDLHDPRLDRLGRLVAVGSGHSLLGNGTVPWVLTVIKHLGGKCVLDLGCGAGQFLNQLALQWPDGSGIGIDMDPHAIAEARRVAAEYGVGDRLTFHLAKLSAEPMDLSEDVKQKVDVLTAMYILHEFRGRGGDESIVAVLASLRQQFPGRKLLMVEGTRADPLELNATPPRTFGQLDYSFLHPLSRQGPLLTPPEWEELIGQAGARLVERVAGFRIIPSWIQLYMIGL
jgi:SAM-dependent methyltransferase